VRPDGRAVTGRPTESAWLLHSGEKGTIEVKHMESLMRPEPFFKENSGNAQKPDWYKRVTGF